MIRVYSTVFLLAMTFALMSLEVEGQSTIDDESETCDSSLHMSEQVANLIRKGLEKVIVSNQQQPRPDPETSKQALVSALVCE